MASRPVALITAAGGALGAVRATELADRNYDLVMMTRSDAPETLAAEIGGLGLRGSVTEESGLARMAETALLRFGHIDAVVNNTGHARNTGAPRTGPQFDADADLKLLSLDDEAWRQALDMIFLKVVRMSRLVTDVMVSQGGGAIVNITSFVQKGPSFAYPTGSWTRMALAGFVKLFADSRAS